MSRSRTRMLRLAVGAALFWPAGPGLSQALPDYGAPAPGRLIKVGDRKLHLLCKGSGTPTVVIEPGIAVPSALWWPVQDRIAQFTRVCSYDRAGYGWSSPARLPRTVEQRADDLNEVLTRGGERGPFVLVAHSYGGLIVRTFARARPSAAAGMVLVDSVEENASADPAMIAESLKAEARVREVSAQLAEQYPQAKQALAATLDEIVDEGRSLRTDAARLATPIGAGGFGALPIAVISRGVVATAGDAARADSVWVLGQWRLATLSTRAKLTVATKSGHNIFQDQPDLVVDATREMVEALRHPQ